MAESFYGAVALAVALPPARQTPSSAFSAATIMARAAVAATTEPPLIGTSITVTNNTYSIYINGSSTPANTLVTSLNPHGHVGLYDDQPNTTTGSGFGPTTSYSDFTLVGTLYKPSLGIQPAGLSQVTLLWTTNAVGWTLQSTPSFSPTNWAAVTTVPVIVGTNFTVTVSNTNAEQFYRLLGN